MTPSRPSRIVWLTAATAFHLVVLSALWRVRVPIVAAPPPPLALHILPTLARPAGEGAGFVEPELTPASVARPYLRPPALALEAASLMPGPYPLPYPGVAARRVRPLAPSPAAPPAATQGDPVAILPREPPVPLVE